MAVDIIISPDASPESAEVIPVPIKQSTSLSDRPTLLPTQVHIPPLQTMRIVTESHSYRENSAILEASSVVI